MCGISGYLGHMRSRDAALEALRMMTDAIIHRGPDDSGYWLDVAEGVALGNRRLAVIDPSPAGHQPMESADGRYVITYNGEVYNFRDLRSELESMGRRRFRGHSDTEVILEAISHWGLESAVQRLNGMFAFALWDRRERLLHLARDRMGKKPVYYGWSGDTFLFGSELKALRTHPDFSGDIDRDALALFMRHDYIPSPHCIYRGLHKVPAGTLVTLSAATKQVTPRQFWSFEEMVRRAREQPFEGDPAEAVQHLDELLGDAVSIRMIADVPVGAFLSGGIDSSTVVALMQAQSSQPVRTFTIGFHEGPYNEAEYAKAVAHHLGTDHTELYVSPEEVMAVIPRLATIYDEPFADNSQIPTFLISELARRQVTVSLSGDGGDELFGGYDRYQQGRRIWRAVGWLSPKVRSRLGQWLTTSPSDRWAGILSPVTRSRPVRRIGRLGELLALRDPGQLYRGLVSHWSPPEEVVIEGHEPGSVLTHPRQWPDLNDFVQRASYLDSVTYLPDDILVKVDRASMAISLEARAPLLDPRVVEFAWSLPLSLKIRNGKSKWILRELLDRYVPKDLVERPKMGFSVPIDSWLRGPLREWAEALLDERRLKAEGFFNAAPIRKRWSEHVTGECDWHYHLWDVLMFQAWLEEWGSPT